MLGARKPVLGAHQVAAAAAGCGPVQALVAANLFNACMSVPTLDREGLAGDRAAHAAPKGTVGGARGAQPAGIPCGVLIAPLMPGINDDPKQVEPIIEAAVAGGTVSIGGQALFLPGAVREPVS